MYQQQNSHQPSFVQSQYRGASSTQGRYQPTGYVQSYYQGTAATPSYSGAYSSGFQGQSSFGQSGYGNTESYHTANYQGNQPGHVQYLRADSTNPSSYGSGASSSYQGSFQSMGQSLGQSSQPGSYASTASYHTADYRGNQPGHDQYLRADSISPSTGYGSSSMMGAGTSGFGITGSSIGQPMGSPGSEQMQSLSPQTYHTASYQGNQPGHDNYLRADSTQPSSIGQHQGQYGSYGMR